MRSLLVLLVSAVAAFGSELPSELAALKAKRDAKVAEIDRIYAAELEKLQKRLMQAGNLKAANEVEEEIARVVPNPFSLKTVLVSRAWIYSVPNGKTTTVDLKPNGTAIDHATGETIWRKWDVTDENALKVEYIDGGSCVFEFGDMVKLSVTGRTHNGLKRSIRPADNANSTSR